MILKIVLILFTTMSSYAQEVNYTPVPKGNRSASMPKIPDSSIDRLKRFVTWQTREDQIEGRFQAIMKELDNPRTKRWIISAAMLYDIDPTLIVGCIVGEHTFNVDWKDYYQNLAAEMTLGWVNKLAQSTYKISDYVTLPETALCRGQENDHLRWECFEKIYNQKFRGRTMYGITYPNDGFAMTFFNPLGRGLTYGIGQLGPITMLRVSDMVSQHSHFTPLDVTDLTELFSRLLNIHQSLHYIAANIRLAIDLYKEIAGFDISQNPGVVATLYNLGRERDKATKLSQINAKRAAQGLPPQLPSENYYGWLVNSKENEIRKLLSL